MLSIYTERLNEIQINYGQGKTVCLAWGFFRTQRFLEGLQSGTPEARRIANSDYPNGEEINEVYINKTLVFKNGERFY